ncbi:MAG TPA: peptidoglycan glycosyltransferase [Clostridiaceae bacterium]|nr:peptidoglycan glycosyltransferase [Clostridiaceae bacterium]
MNMERRTIYVLVFVSLLFFILVGYLTCFELFQKDRIVSNPYNRRQYEIEEKTLRGSIYDSRGKVLANSVVTDGVQKREYPYGPMYSHVIGYSSRKYGKSLIEAKFNNYLLGMDDSSAVLSIKDKLTGNAREGNDIYLTIDHELQEKAYNLLGDRKGAIVAMNPKTGEILAMVSKPDFNPDDSELEKNWSNMIDDEDAPFLTRATQGLYTPGSTYKVVIGAAAVENNLSDKIYEDKGTATIDGKKISNSGGKAYGKIDIKTAMAVSSNVVFATIGCELGEDNLKEIAQRVGLGASIPFDIPVSQSAFKYNRMSNADMAAVGIGQGKILVTPLHMALITSAIANDGVMMKPILVSRVERRSGIVLKRQKPSELYRIMSPETASHVKDMMVEVVESGTGKKAAVKGIKVAGKTGTAENELTARQKNKEHAWFIGFAPADDPQIAVAVILEYSGSTGGSAAAPIARDLISAWVK